MGFLQREVPVIKNEKIAEGFYDLVVSFPEAAEKAAPGQFADIRCAEKTLRRPISLCEIDRDEGTLRMVYEVRGEGTRWLSEVSAGEMLDVLAPLGHGFTLDKSMEHVVFVGGGIGVPPLLEGAKSVASCDAVLGFRTAGAAVLTKDFALHTENLLLASDDGTLGTKGFVTGLLQKRLEEKPCSLICACGPLVMLEKIASLAKQYGIPCEVSLEQRMACGVGACLGCACRLRDENGREYYGHVCKNGPVFRAEEVVF